MDENIEGVRATPRDPKQEDRELRMWCLDHTLRYHGGNSEAAITDAEKLYAWVRDKYEH